jgi:hemerythrin-like domain-containing protein
MYIVKEISNTIYVNTPLTPAQVEYLLKNLDEFVSSYFHNQEDNIYFNEEEPKSPTVYLKEATNE